MSDAAPVGHPRSLSWLGTSALAMGGSNQMVFLAGALIATQGSGAVPILIIGVVLAWMAAPGWTELVLMWPDPSAASRRRVPRRSSPTARCS